MDEGEQQPDKTNEDSVGYCRPPKEHQFKKGTSGNRRGRPKGKKGIGAILRRAMDAKVEIRSGEKTRRISAGEGVLSRLFNSALKGDYKAAEQVVRLMERHGIEAVSEAKGSSLEEEISRLECLTDDELEVYGYLAHKMEGKLERWEEERRQSSENKCRDFAEKLASGDFEGEPSPGDAPVRRDNVE